MLDAIDMTNETIGLGGPAGPAAPADAAAVASQPVPTAADNDRALAELSKLMGGAVAR